MKQNPAAGIVNDRKNGIIYSLISRHGENPGRLFDYNDLFIACTCNVPHCVIGTA